MSAYKSVVSHISGCSIITSVVAVLGSALLSSLLSNIDTANAKKPIRSSVNRVAKRLKYLSMNTLIGCPNLHISQPIRKKRNPRDTADAMINIGKLMPNIPPAIVKSLNGSGVKPAVKTIQKLYLSYIPPTLSKLALSKILS